MDLVIQHLIDDLLVCHLTAMPRITATTGLTSDVVGIIARVH